MSKDLKLLVQVIVYFILLFIFSWYEDITSSMSPIFLVGFLVNLVLFFLTFIILIIKSIKSIIEKKGKSCSFISLAILLMILSLTWCDGFRFIRIKVDTILYEKDRKIIINMINDDKLLKDDYNNVKLPKEYSFLSSSGEVHVYEHNGDELVSFWVIRGFLSGSIEIVYSPSGEGIIRDVIPYINSLTKLQGNWYYIETE